MYWPLMLQGRTLKVIGIAILLVALAMSGLYLRHSGYQEGYQEADQKGQIELANYKAAQQSAVDKIVAENRKTEEALQTQMLQNYVEKEREIQNINDTTQRMLSSLRHRPTRSNGSESSVSPGTAADSTQCPREACSGKELSREDGEFLIGEAAGADTLKQALLSCRSAYDRITKE